MSAPTVAGDGFDPARFEPVSWAEMAELLGLPRDAAREAVAAKLRYCAQHLNYLSAAVPFAGLVALAVLSRFTTTTPADQYVNVRDLAEAMGFPNPGNVEPIVLFDFIKEKIAPDDTFDWYRLGEIVGCLPSDSKATVQQRLRELAKLTMTPFTAGENKPGRQVSRAVMLGAEALVRGLREVVFSYLPQRSTLTTLNADKPTPQLTGLVRAIAAHKSAK